MIQLFEDNVVEKDKRDNQKKFSVLGACVCWEKRKIKSNEKNNASRKLNNTFIVANGSINLALLNVRKFSLKPKEKGNNNVKDRMAETRTTLTLNILLHDTFLVGVGRIKKSLWDLIGEGTIWLILSKIKTRKSMLLAIELSGALLVTLSKLVKKKSFILRGSSGAPPTT